MLHVRESATEQFGPPTTISGEFHNWELEADKLPAALEFAIADDVRPRQALGPVSLYVSYSLRWRSMPNPPPGETTQFFGRGSSMGVSVGGRRVFVQPAFLFAASDKDPMFRAELRSFERTLPFKPKSNYYYRIEAKKSGAGDKLVKLPEGWCSVA